MNWLLILVVLLVAGNIVWGFFRGFLRVVYSMAAWILILVFVTFATPYVADWMTEHTGLDTRIEKNCKEKLQNAVAGEEKSTEEQNTQEQKDLLNQYAETFSGKKQKNDAYPKYASFLDRAKKFLGIE